MDKQITHEIRKHHRQHVHQLWEKIRDEDFETAYEKFDSDEKQLAKILDMHRDEFFNEFQMLDHMEEHEYDEGTSDPFMHLLIHQIIDNQLNNKDPIEAYQFYLSMQKHKADHHDILHLMGALFMPQLFSSLKGEPVNEEEKYLFLLKKFKNRKPKSIWKILGY